MTHNALEVDMNSKGFWHLLMAGSLGLWLLSGLAIYLMPGSFAIRFLPAGLALLHLSEIPVASLRIGKEKGLSAGTVILKTFLFGFTWWLPLKKGILKG